MSTVYYLICDKCDKLAIKYVLNKDRIPTALCVVHGTFNTSMKIDKKEYLRRKKLGVFT